MEKKLTELDEQIVYDQLDLEETAIWSLLLASGYLKVEETSCFARAGVIVTPSPRA